MRVNEVSLREGVAGMGQADERILRNERQRLVQCRKEEAVRF